MLCLVGKEVHTKCVTVPVEIRQLKDAVESGPLYENGSRKNGLRLEQANCGIYYENVLIM
jgi:hypothetical protein